jgi:hypothetical protein
LELLLQTTEKKELAEIQVDVVETSEARAKRLKREESELSLKLYTKAFEEMERCKNEDEMF